MARRSPKTVTITLAVAALAVGMAVGCAAPVPSPPTTTSTTTSTVPTTGGRGTFNVSAATAAAGATLTVSGQCTEPQFRPPLSAEEFTSIGPGVIVYFVPGVTTLPLLWAMSATEVGRSPVISQTNWPDWTFNVTVPPMPPSTGLLVAACYFETDGIPGEIISTAPPAPFTVT